jgi:TRAP-type C4-dicarboxylate transport system substrate-binding protein
MYVANFTDGISRATYNALSDAQKKAIDSVCTTEWSRLVYKYWYQDAIKREQDVRKSDRKLTKIGPDEVKLWREAARPVYDTWADAVRKAGYDPAQVLKELQAELKKEGALFEGAIMF